MLTGRRSDCQHSHEAQRRILQGAEDSLNEGGHQSLQAPPPRRALRWPAIPVKPTPATMDFDGGFMLYFGKDWIDWGRFEMLQEKQDRQRISDQELFAILKAADPNNVNYAQIAETSARLRILETAMTNESSHSSDRRRTTSLSVGRYR